MSGLWIVRETTHVSLLYFSFAERLLPHRQLHPAKASDREGEACHGVAVSEIRSICARSLGVRTGTSS